ncbi:MAG: hypothetical protein ACSHXJ_12310 [Marinomonas colpomeniae]
MSSKVLTNMSLTVKRRGFVCLVLFVLSLSFSLMATNTMMGDSSMTSMDHTMSQMDSDSHDMSSHCASILADHCGGMSSDHKHQSCMDTHCSSFSSLLVSYHSNLGDITSIQTILESKSYVSTYPNTPYFPPIIIS